MVAYRVKRTLGKSVPTVVCWTIAPFVVGFYRRFYGGELPTLE